LEKALTKQDPDRLVVGYAYGAPDAICGNRGPMLQKVAD
jgi:hypothetical protein